MIQLDETIIEKLSSRGVLAYVAVNMAGAGVYSTANLAFIVHSSSNIVIEGLKELAQLQPESLQSKKNKWYVGGEVKLDGALQAQTERRQSLIDDLKKYWDHLNPGREFPFGPEDGMAVNRFLKRHTGWTRADWQRALNYRARSEGIIATFPIYRWLSTLDQFLAGPTDRYGKAMPHGIGGKHGKAVDLEAGNRAAREFFTAGQNRVG